MRRCFELCSRLAPQRIYPYPARLGMDALRIAEFTRHRHGQQTTTSSTKFMAARSPLRSGVATERDAYFVDEYGFADDAAAELIPALLRAAAGDLRRIVGWLPPSGARELLPRGSVRKRKSSVLMAAPLTAAGTRLIKSALAPSEADFCWATDHI